ncbi:MAG: DMT family transporter [Leptospirillia bacterium]
MRQTPLFPALALLLLSLIWGYNWVVMKTALADCPPLLFAAMRVLGGTLVLFSILRAMGRPLAMPPVRYVLPLGLLQSTGFVGCTLWALEYGGAGKTAILVYMMPLWLVLLTAIFLGERIRGLEKAALGIALAGLLLILAPWHLEGGRGILLALLSGIFWALSAVWQKKHGALAMDILDVTAWQMLLGGIVLLGVAALVDPWRIHWTPALSLALFYNAVPGNALAWLLWSYALNRLPSGVAGMGTLLAPAVGILASWGQLGEVPNLSTGAGMGLIFLSMVLVVREHLKGREASSFLEAQE